MQFTLDQLFEKRQGDQLTLQAYHDLGKMKGALAGYAEKIYKEGLPSDEHRRLTRMLFMRLIDLGATEQDTTRRRATLSEFSLTDPKQTLLLRETMDVFVMACLLTTNEVAGIVTVEVSHEALIREWSLLLRWIREFRDNLPLQQTLTKDVAGWERLGKPKERLYRDSQLKKASVWAKDNTLNRQELQFLHASHVHQWHRRINVGGIALASVLIVALIARLVLYFQPSWCPQFLCPSVLVTNPQGVHDSNLEVYFTALQSTSYEIPGNPENYVLSNLPKDVGAVHLDQPDLSLYKVALGVHSIQQGRFGLFIVQVNLIIKHIPSTPYPLNLWTEGNLLEYNSNPYKVSYRGQSEEAILPATYTRSPYVPMQLLPGESDGLSLQVISYVPVSLQFSVQIIYRVANESQLYTLTLPRVFEVIFSNSSNWHPYTLQNGHFVPSS